MRVKLFNKISTSSLETSLGKEFQEVDDNPDLIFVRSAKLHDPGMIPETTRAIFRAGSGVDNIPIDTLTERGIPVFNTPGANTNSVKELVLGIMLALSRNCFQAFDFVRSSDQNTDFEKVKKQFCGNEIAGKKILIIGLGNVGLSLARTCHSLGMSVYGYSRHRKNGLDWLCQLESLDDRLAAGCDFVSLHIPNNQNTFGIVNQKLVSRLKPGVILLNFARKELIDIETLVSALETGQIRFYASDFVEEGLKKYVPSRVIMLPHLGASTEEAESRAIQIAGNQAHNFWFFGDTVNSINFPRVITDHKLNQPRRITIAAFSTSEVVLKIQDLTKELRYRILDFNYNNRIFYAVVEARDPLTEAVFCQRLKQLTGILKTRLIELPVF